MSTDPRFAPSPSGPSSRRALLGAGLGALAATVASALGRPHAVQATHGDVHLGIANPATTTTKISAGSGTVFRADSGSGIGVFGLSSSYVGVLGHSSSGVGILGSSAAPDEPAMRARSYGDSTGLLGSSGALGGSPDAKAKTGVYGEATQDDDSRGVWGRSDAGVGVFGQATSGVAVRGVASEPAGFGLHTVGRLKLEAVSGVATIPAEATSIIVTPIADVFPGAFVLLTPKANLGGRDLWFFTTPASGTFTIRISSARPSPTKIAWLLIG